MNTFWSLLIAVVAVVLVQTIFFPKGVTMNVPDLKKKWNPEVKAKGETILVDVREPAEFAAGHVPGAINIPLGQIETRSDELKSGKTLFVICQAGGRSAKACGILGPKFPEKVVINVAGGTGAWIGAGFPVEK
ncbi:MAG: rhodanese-like domain-containing protein [Candidatus Ozemobacteraceae bacterium]